MREDGFAWLDAIEIYEEHRSKGLGAQVMAMVEAELAAKGITSMSLSTDGGNERALKFYRREGYAITYYHLRKAW